ncbi:OPT oligopeptide transporter protein-domain-containing protein [Multifurca ochricompacta]|uniref:OPT oligopeptide transporter protein-domain-containing protein n=1 Tax=Multifurca ochricompacta TaxID=376703 RepID=A0AAD4MAK3_9AGAM|nr:OPT oligopeptide transporter protein-domain-containing protein [Multifurca ochricompacta]
MNTILAAQPSFNEEYASAEKPLEEKNSYLKADVESASGSDTTKVLHNERDIATNVIPVEDDPSLNPWTFRSFFIGIGLSTFGSVLAEIYYFKPQTIFVSTMFLAIISYLIGISMEVIIPRSGWFRYLNPGPFNKKENAFIVIMASAAANSALGTEVLAVQRLFYNITPNHIASIFLLFSSQLLGFAILLYPSKMLYPGVLPLVSMFDAFYTEGSSRRYGSNKKRLMVFYIAFLGISIWELFPEWIFPLLTGLSVFCLSNPTSPDFTRVFGGSNGNEGLGLLSLCFDWQYISIAWNPFVIPLKVQISSLIGYILCLVVFVAVYYNNVWESRKFPFLSQELFYENGTVYNQLLILNDKLEVDPNLLAQQGLPFYAGTWVAYLLTSNMGLAATFTHLLLWNRNDLRAAWSWINKESLEQMWAQFNWRFWKADGKRKAPTDEDIDPHYKEMFKASPVYPDAPNSWYVTILVFAFITAMALIYKTESTLPWWGFIIACLLAAISILFFGSLFAMTGIRFIIQPFVQMIGGFLHPRKPMANMYFVLFSYNSVNQAELLLNDLKIAQYTKLPPRAAFTAQIIGTLVGSVLNYIMMNSIIDHQREILLSVEGTNIWSGQQPQQYNSQSIAWGGLPHELFATGKRYQWVSWAYALGLLVPIPFWLLHQYYPKLRADYMYTPIIVWFIGVLAAGINTPVTMYVLMAWFSQWYMRTRHPKWFAKYNYILGAGLDGGTQVMVFILSFAVQGAAGVSHPFPRWWGANQDGNYDRCAVIPSS